MLDQKKLAIALFASLGVNIFLGGLIGGQMLSVPESAPKNTTADNPKKPKAAKSTTDQTDDRQRHPEAADRSGPDRSGPDRSGRRGAGPRAGGPPQGPPPAGSSDLMLLRQMVRIMGGPDEPRIKEIREKKKPDIEKMRGEMKDAHERVHQALAADPLVENDLQEALKHLRKTTFEAQARAQEGIVTLAELMNAEERKKLREFKPRGLHEHGPHEHGPHRGVKPGPGEPPLKKDTAKPDDAPAP